MKLHYLLTTEKKIATAITTYGTTEERIDYTYTGDLITKIETKEDGILIETETFEYNAANKLVTYVALDILGNIGVKETYVHNTDGSIAVSRFIGDLVTQTDADGTSMIAFANGEVSQIAFSSGETKVYTYDTRNNAFRNVIGYPQISFTDGEAQGNAKNILKEEINAVPYYEFTYSYTALDFPLTATENSGAIVNYTY